MGKFVDSVIAFRILRLLTTPFDETPAYALGIIDGSGKELRKMRDLHTVEERDAYTLLHRLVYRLKRIIERVPLENKKLVSFAAAYSLVKESLDAGHEPIDLESRFINKLTENLEHEVALVEEYLNESKIFTFKQFSEEMGGVAANNAAATPGMGGLPPDQAPVSKKAQKKWVTTNKIFRRQ